MSAVGLRGRTGQQSRVTRWFIIPRVEEFEDNYLGQWLQVTGTTEADDEVADNCEFANWDAGEAIAYDALLLDRRSEAPLSIEMTAYGDSERDEIRESTVFIVNQVEECGNEWIGLSCESVPQRAVAGKPAGPTVAESDGGVGFGGLAALSAVGIAVAARLLGSGGDSGE